MVASERSIWVLEGILPDSKVIRWELPSLDDDTVREHLGFIPGGLWPPSPSLLVVLRDVYGIDLNPSTFQDLLIGKEAVGQGSA